VCAHQPLLRYDDPRPPEMLTATSDLVFGTSRVRSTIVLERRFRAHVLYRERLVFDSRFHPSTRRSAGSTLYVVVAGALQINHAATVVGPHAYLLSEREFERMSPDATTFRSWGAPSVTLELRLATDDVRAPVGLAAGPLALGASTWSRCHAIGDACAASEPIEQLVRQLLGDLRDDGVLGPGVVASEPITEPEAFVRLWAAVRPFFASQAVSMSVRDVARATGVSLRQLGRVTKDFARAFDLGDGFRDALRVTRVRMAILLLSAPTATATEVAKQIGYKSLEAMERAFRDADLPPPSIVQDAIRYPE
jgi:AraC-like DNA-binding protein